MRTTALRCVAKHTPSSRSRPRCINTFGTPRPRFRIVDEFENNGLRSGSIDQFLELPIQAQLRADSEWYVFVRLRFLIHATAYSGHSEINFADGSANFIEPLLVMASPD